MGLRRRQFVCHRRYAALQTAALVQRGDVAAQQGGPVTAGDNTARRKSLRGWSVESHGGIAVPVPTLRPSHPSQ
jgi:hypothetical protein